MHLFVFRFPTTEEHGVQRRLVRLGIAAAITLPAAMWMGGPARAAGGDPPDVVDRPVATGDDHSCAIDAGKVYCWGIDNVGQLGNGPELTTDQPAPVPVLLPADETFAAVVAADVNTYALSTRGEIWAWGQDRAALPLRGDGPTETAVQAPPTRLDISALPAGLRFVDVTAGETFGCAVADDANLYCWGSDSNGQSGDGDGPANPSPVAVPVPAGETGWARVAAGSLQVCGVTVAGNLYCWGGNSYGQVGDGNWNTPMPFVTAVDTSAVPAGTKWAVPSMGDNHSCAISTAGDVYCWGRDSKEQLGDGVAEPPLPSKVSLRPIPSVMPAGVDFVDMAAGDELNCAISSTADVYCWGNLPSGSRNVPTLTDWTFATTRDIAAIDVATSATHICATSTAGAVECTGMDLFGQLGNGTPDVPGPISFPAGPDPVVPEAPVVALLSIAGIGVGALVLRRRQHTLA